LFLTRGKGTRTTQMFSGGGPSSAIFFLQNFFVTYWM